MTSTDHPTRLYTVTEAAPLLRMSRATLYRLLRDKRRPLPHHNIRGTGMRFTTADLDAILAESAQGRP